VALNWSITEGDYEHRSVFQNILIQHENAEAQKYGRHKFKDVLVALGIRESVTDLSVMLHKPCLIGVIIRQDKAGQYPDRNEIGRVMPISTPHNGATRDAVREAQKPQKKDDPISTGNGAAKDLDDEIPF
jgi:hypothetical protein